MINFLSTGLVSFMCIMNCFVGISHDMRYPEEASLLLMSFVMQMSPVLLRDLGEGTYCRNEEKEAV